MKNSLVFRLHAIQRLFQRGISDEEVRQVVITGEVIEVYPDDSPYPSKLILGWSRARPLHVVVAENAEVCEDIVVTVYEPDSGQWEDGFKRRRKQ